MFTSNIIYSTYQIILRDQLNSANLQCVSVAVVKNELVEFVTFWWHTGAVAQSDVLFRVLLVKELIPVLGTFRVPVRHLLQWHVLREELLHLIGNMSRPVPNMGRLRQFEEGGKQ